MVQQVDALLDRAAAAALVSGIDGTIVSTLKQPVTDSSERQLRLSRHLDELAARYGIFDLVAVVDRAGYLLATNLKTPHPSRLDLSRAPQLCWGQDLKIVDREGPWVQKALKDEVSHSGAMKLNYGGDNTVLVATTNSLSNSSWVCPDRAEKPTARKALAVATQTKGRTAPETSALRKDSTIPVRRIFARCRVMRGMPSDELWRKSDDPEVLANREMLLVDSELYKLLTPERERQQRNMVRAMQPGTSG